MFYKLLFFLIAVYLFFRIFTRFLLPWLLTVLMKRMMKKGFKMNMNMHEDVQEKGKNEKLHIHNTKNTSTAKSKNSDGEYVDYTEIED